MQQWPEVVFTAPDLQRAFSKTQQSQDLHSGMDTSMQLTRQGVCDPAVLSV